MASVRVDRDWGLGTEGEGADWGLQQGGESPPGALGLVSCTEKRLMLKSEMGIFHGPGKPKVWESLNCSLAMVLQALVL